MTITELPPQLELTNDPNRSPGLHCSNIIRAAGIRSGVIRPFGDEDASGKIPDDTNREFDDTAKLRMLVGCAFEAEMLRRLPHLFGHPGECYVDGVSMSPDALAWESTPVPVVTRGLKHARRNSDPWEGRWVVHEFKATWKSSRVTPQDLWAYLVQVKSYCRGVGTTAAVLHVLHLCGDYSRPIVPVYHIWNIEFTQQEIDENWEMLTGYARSQGKL